MQREGRGIKTLRQRVQELGKSRRSYKLLSARQSDISNVLPVNGVGANRSEWASTRVAAPAKDGTPYYTRRIISKGTPDTNYTW